MSKFFITITNTLAAILLLTTAVSAIGTLTPSGTAGDDTQYSLNDIYNRITTGATTNAGTGTMTVPTGDPSASFYTLTEIYNALPDWQTLSNSTTTVAEGFYEATDLTSVDSDLAAANIVAGTTILGVEGTNVLDDGDGVTLRSEWSSDIAGGFIFNQATAISECEALSENGHDDWELPTTYELYNALQNGGGYGDFANGEYWSINNGAYKSSPTTGFTVHMVTGDVNVPTNTIATYAVRCIR